MSGFGNAYWGKTPWGASKGDFEEFVTLVETLTLSENLTALAGWAILGNEVLTLSETLAQGYAYSQIVYEVFSALERGTANSFEAISTPDTVLVANPFDFDPLTSLDEILIVPASGQPVRIQGYSFVGDVRSSGLAGYAVDAGSGLDSSNSFRVTGSTPFTGQNLGEYLTIKTGSNTGMFRITAVLDSATVTLDRHLLVFSDPDNGYVDGIVSHTGNQIQLSHSRVTGGTPLVQVLDVWNRTTGARFQNPAGAFDDYRTFTVAGGPIGSPGDRIWVKARVAPTVEWEQQSAAKSVNISTTKFTNGGTYQILVRGKTSSGQFATLVGAFPTTSPRPKVVGAEFNVVSGSVLVEFDQVMQPDDLNLGNPQDYVISGPTLVRVLSVSAVSPTQVLLATSGLGSGSYTLTVSSNTPKDDAGNPIDPAFRTAVFSASVPQVQRSIFTDRGPIAKPPLNLQSGINATISTHNEVILTGAALSSTTHVGKLVTLTGNFANSGTWKILSVLSTSRVRLANASLSLPDASTFTWVVFDPLDGQIADDPADVTVTVNGNPIVPDAVIGLLGQVVLPEDLGIAPGDPGYGASPWGQTWQVGPSLLDRPEILVDYSWVPNPTVEVRRWNSKEFHWNSWNRDRHTIGTQHTYRFNNVWLNPANYNPDHNLADLPEPTARELHYRGFERAYTPVYNDPTLLLWNSPHNRVSYPQLRRDLQEVVVQYTGTGLPEATGWVKHGSGTATSVLGQLQIGDTTSASEIFWTHEMDFTFTYAMGISWRLVINTVPQLEGVFTGLGAGWSTTGSMILIGLLDDGGVKRLGLLQGSDTSLIGSWVTTPLDWSILHTIRVFRTATGVIQVFLDGDVTPALQVAESGLPRLVDLDAQFQALQGLFFGSLSRQAQSTSSWDFLIANQLPVGTEQVANAISVSFEGNVLPHLDPKPWSTLGAYGYDAVVSPNTLLVNDTSTGPGPGGLLEGSYRSHVRVEPLLSKAAEYVLDTEMQVRSSTHGAVPFGAYLAVDNGTALTQLSFLGEAAPKIGFGGGALPEVYDAVWQSQGTSAASLNQRSLRINDTSISDGRVYFADDLLPGSDPNRVFLGTDDYAYEFRVRVNSYTPDGGGFCGVFAQVYDSTRSVGVFFQQLSGVRYVAFHSDGTALGASHRFVFDWSDGAYHTIRIVKNTLGGLVSVIVDGVFLGASAYTAFTAPAPDPIGQVSFGSSTPASAQSASVVDWAHVNGWRVLGSQKRYVGLWQGTQNQGLLDFVIPTKVQSRGTLLGSTIQDTAVNFVALTVAAGDKVLIRSGANTGTYTVQSVATNVLTFADPFPTQPTTVDYEVLRETDWTALTKYRVYKDTSGEIGLVIGNAASPSLRMGVGQLPVSSGSPLQGACGGLPYVAFGSLESSQIAQSAWNHVRYTAVRSPTEMRIAPHHQVTNQWNLMHSPERLFSSLAHTLTSFKSSSTGVPPRDEPDFLEHADLQAFTTLNQDTPLVPLTQSFEARKPYLTQIFQSAMNTPDNVFNNPGDFVYNDGDVVNTLVVPKDVLYSSLKVIEQTSGSPDLLAPFEDTGFELGTLTFAGETCLVYDGSTLPEDAAGATPWTLESDTPGQVTATSILGVLTYSTTGPTKTIYRNNTPLPDSPSLRTEAKFRLRVLADATGGTGDSEIRVGLSAPDFTVALAFVTQPTGQRMVLVKDLTSGLIVGGRNFDFLDGAYHDYSIIRDPGNALVEVVID